MKSSISYSLLLAAAACGVAVGQTTAYTTPVGYMSVTVPAQSDTNISLPLETAVAWAGVSTGVSSDVISVAASFTADQYANAYMVKVTSGVLAGRQFKVIANDAGSLTVDPAASNSLQSQGFASGDRLVIRPFWTPNTLFPNGQGIGASSDPFSPTTFLMVNTNDSTGTNRAPSSFLFYYDGAAGGDAAWYNADSLEIVNDLVIDSSVTLTVRNSTDSLLTLVNQGTVPSLVTSALVVGDVIDSDTFLQLPYPVDSSLNQSNLFESGAVAASSDPFAPTDFVFVFDPAATGFNASPSAFYFYYDGSAGGDAGWYDTSDLSMIGDNLLLKAGSSIMIRKGAGSALQATAWNAPLPYSL